MADQLSWSAAGELLAGFVPEGPARTAVLLVYGLCVAVAPFFYKYYLGVLAQGAAPEGSLERQDHDRLRASLAGGNLAARLYAKWLTAFLDWIERFFGDAGIADRTLLPRAFGLKKRAPLWAAPAFDRCLLVALIYPIVTIFLIWAVSGQIGPAEAALGLNPEVPGGRGLVAVAVGFQGFAFWRAKQATGWVRGFFWLLVGAGFTGLVLGAGGPAIAAVAGVTVGMFAFFSVVAGASRSARLRFPSSRLTGWGVGTGGDRALVTNFAGVGVAGLAGVVAVIPLILFHPGVLTGGFAGGLFNVVVMPSYIANKRRWQGRFLALFVVAMILASLASADLLSPLEGWKAVGPLLLFLGLLTLLNAPCVARPDTGAAAARARTRRLVALSPGTCGRGARRGHRSAPRADHGYRRAGL